jgi:hypothetical protein
MSVQFKFFSLPILCEEDMEEELNTFLRGIRIIAVHREMVAGGRFPVASSNPLLIPAKAGIQKFDERTWIPAFAGMTE